MNSHLRTTIEDLAPGISEIPADRLRYVTGGGSDGTVNSTSCVTHNGASADTMDNVKDSDDTVFAFSHSPA